MARILITTDHVRSGVALDALAGLPELAVNAHLIEERNSR
ncbi:hypothetical protein BJ988_002820 [Nocardioides panzhihuensis]|uniref:Uncharacterized protein n=1 Tax=Nocardioides panzhihuensis TaxID=860243 RepID=A0A7Z0ISV5_9ACTN|nr:hypothetical protein [Nocardioides panzhihuensis]